MSASKKRRRPGAKVCIGQAGFNALAILADCKSRDGYFSRLPNLRARRLLRPEFRFDSSGLTIKPIFRTIGINPRTRVRAHRGKLGINTVSFFRVAGLLA
jgi:hypothetical protein